MMTNPSLGSDISDLTEPVTCEEAAYELPYRGRKYGQRPVQKRELFALSSALYEISV